MYAWYVKDVMFHHVLTIVSPVMNHDDRLRDKYLRDDHFRDIDSYVIRSVPTWDGGVTNPDPIFRREIGEKVPVQLI